MANIKSFPNNQDEYIGAEYVMKWLHGRTSGVFAAENNASVTAVQNEMAVNVSDGLGWIANAGKDGVVWWIDNAAVNGSALKLAIDAADSTLNRIDRIIVEWKTTNYVDYPEVKVLKGSLASTASAPALTNNSTVRQISLARVAVNAGTTAITPSMITDERLDASVCGLVTESIRIDTSTMQNQFEALLTAIQKELQDLNEGTASLLKSGGTMYGNIDMENNRILNIPTPENDSDPATKKFVEGALEDALKSKLAMELLWENASPTSTLPGQTVNMDLRGFHFFVVAFKFSKTSTHDRTPRFVEKGKLTSIMEPDTLGALSRNITFNDDSFNFSGIVEGSNKTDDNFIITRIYGIKGVSA